MGNFGDIGTAHVTVELDFERALRELQDSRQSLDVRVDLDQSQVNRELEATLDKASSAAGDTEARVSFDDDATARALKKTLSDAARNSDRDSSRSFTKLGGSAGTGFFGGFFRRIASLNFGGRLLKVIKPVALIAALGLVTQALGAVGAGAVALVAVIGPLSGALIALPAILGAVQQGMLVTKLSMIGVADALGGLHDEIDKDKLAKLTPPAQQFVRVLDAVKPRIIDLQKALQSAAFPGFTAAVKNLAPLLDALRPGLVGTATILGGLADSLGRVAATMRGDLADIIALNNTTIRNLGLAAGEIGKTFVDALLAARPLINFITGGLLQLTTRLSDVTAAARASGGLADFFASTRKTMIIVLRLFSALGGVLGTVFSAALPLGLSLLKILTRNTRELGAFLDSPKGQNALKKFFEAAGPIILKASKLIGAVGLAFLRLSTTKGLGKAFDDIRTKLLPAFESLVKVTTDKFLPILLPAISNLVLLLTDISGSTGGLNGVVKAVGNLAGKLHDIAVDHPLLLRIANEVLTGIALLSFAGLLAGVSALAGLTRGMGLLASAMKFILSGRLALAITGIGRALIGLALGPVGAAIAIVAGVGLAFKLAWDNSELFRKASQKVSDAAVAAIPGLGNMLRSLSDIVLKMQGVKGAADQIKLSAATTEFAKFREAHKNLSPREAILAFRELKGEATAATRATAVAALAAAPSVKKLGEAAGSSRSIFANLNTAVGTALSGLGATLTRVSKAAGGAIKAIGNQVKISLAKANIDQAKAGIVGFSSSLRRFMVNAWGAAAGSRILGLALTLLRAPINGIRTAFSGLVAGMLRAVAVTRTQLAPGIIGAVLSIRTSLLGISFQRSGERIMSTLLTGLRIGFDEIKVFIRGIATWIQKNKGPISADRKLLVPAGAAIMQGFDSGLRNRWNPVKNWVSNIGSFFKGIVSGDALKGTISSILLGKGGKLSDLSGILAKALGVPPGLIGTGGLGGFLHPTSGWADTLSQAHIIDRLFHAHMGSGLRSFDTVPGPGVSQHTLGQAVDWGDKSNTQAALFGIAKFASRLPQVFKQVIWQNRLWMGGTASGGFVPDHMDHVHLGWQARRAAGGAVQKGQRYQWNERGAEMFVPQQSGYVMNAGRTKELVSAIRSLAQRPASSDSRNAVINVHSNAADPVAVGGIVMSNLGSVFARA